jgi:hypothetical protein
VDGQTADEYAAQLEGNLQALLERAKSGTYRAPPVRRAYIPKDSGEMRPLGIPTFEDKVLQRTVTMVLEAVYEQGVSGLLVRLPAWPTLPSGPTDAISVSVPSNRGFFCRASR